MSFNNTVRLETEADTAGEIKTKNLVLPEEFDIPRSLLFKTTHTSVQILLDGEEIYQYGHEENAPKFMKSPGSCWHIADIPKNSAGKELEIRILPAYSGYYGNNISLYLGTRGDCILRILSDSLGILDVYKRQVENSEKMVCGIDASYRKIECRVCRINSCLLYTSMQVPGIL